METPQTDGPEKEVTEKKGRGRPRQMVPGIPEGPDATPENVARALFHENQKPQAVPAPRERIDPDADIPSLKDFDKNLPEEGD